MVIANGRTPGIVQSAVRGQSVGTRFRCASKGLPSRKHWIAYTLKPSGVLQLDEGASRAVKETGASILPVGIASVEGRFEPGDAVRIVDFEGNEIARGLVRQSALDLIDNMGAKGAPVVHRDDLVMR